MVLEFYGSMGLRVFSVRYAALVIEAPTWNPGTLEP